MPTGALKCGYCGMEIASESAICHGCGTPAPASSGERARSIQPPSRAKLIFLVLCLLVATVCLVQILRPGHLTKPRDYTTEELATVLRERLSPDEVPGFENPLEATPEMAVWAHKLVAGATNNLDKAKMIFDELVSRVASEPAQFHKAPTAKEIFADWNHPGASFRCQEFAFLYVALARAVGLKAYHVCVTEDCRGVQVLHGCGAVFEDSKPVLVDVMYSVFGVVHKRFRVLDDLQTAAIYLCGLEDLRGCRIASKLAPDLPIVRANLFEMLMAKEEWGEAQHELSELAKLDPHGPMTYSARAIMASHGGDYAQAEQLLRKAVQMAPETERFLFLLGSMRAAQGKLDEARRAYEKALVHAVYESGAATTKGAIALIDGEECRARGDAHGAISNYDRAVSLRPDYFQAYMRRGRVREEANDFEGAAADYDKVIQLKPSLAEAYFYRANMKYVTHDLDGALSDYNQAYSLYPQMGLAFGMLGCLYYDRHEFTEALSAFRKACEAGPFDDYIRFRIYLTRSRLEQMVAAIKELQEYLASRKPLASNQWPLCIGQFLAGQVTEADFFKAAENEDKKTNMDQHCEAWFYAGSKRLLQGEQVVASNYFENCAASGIERLLEHASAVHELRLLKADKKSAKIEN